MNEFYIGIDPSLTCTGISIIINSFTGLVKRTTQVRTSSSLDTFTRILMIRDFIHVFVQDACATYIQDSTSDDCKGVCIEGPSNNSVGRHDDLGQLRGVIKALVADEYKSATQIAPKMLKKFGANHGDASKTMMVEAAQLRDWDIKDGEDDKADASHLAELAYSIFSEAPIVGYTRKQLEVLRDLDVAI